MMQTWSITLHGPAGVISSVDTGESQFVVGTETASDVFTIQGEGVRSFLLAPFAHLARGVLAGRTKNDKTTMSTSLRQPIR
jgi:hypothetical protein